MSKTSTKTYIFSPYINVILKISPVRPRKIKKPMKNSIFLIKILQKYIKIFQILSKKTKKKKKSKKRQGPKQCFFWHDPIGKIAKMSKIFLAFPNCFWH